jgi:ketosteroid isomerase-like protein
MSRENVELVRMLQPTGVDMVVAVSAQDAFGGLPDSLFAPDLEVSFSAVDAGAKLGPFHGPDAFSTAWRDWLEPWGRYEIETEELLDAGEHVVAFVRVRGRTRRDGVEFEHAPAAVWTVRDGRVAALRFYLDRDEALAVAGLVD